MSRMYSSSSSTRCTCYASQCNALLFIHAPHDRLTTKTMLPDTKLYRYVKLVNLNFVSLRASTRLIYFIISFSWEQGQVLPVQQSHGPVLQRPLQLDHAAPGQRLRRMLRENGPGNWNA
jgi:hypothetical protein